MFGHKWLRSIQNTDQPCWTALATRKQRAARASLQPGQPEAARNTYENQWKYHKVPMKIWCNRRSQWSAVIRFVRHLSIGNFVFFSVLTVLSCAISIIFYHYPSMFVLLVISARLCLSAAPCLHLFAYLHAAWPWQEDFGGPLLVWDVSLRLMTHASIDT